MCISHLLRNESWWFLFFIRHLNLTGPGALHNGKGNFSSNYISNSTGWWRSDQEEEHDLVCISYVDNILSESAFRMMDKVMPRYRER